MGSALTAGILNSKVLDPALVAVHTRREEVGKSFADKHRCEFVSDLGTLAAESACLLLAVKPYQIVKVLSDALDGVSESKLIISVAAGTTASTLATAAGLKHRIVRVMPNTPSLIGEGASGIAKGPNATDEDLTFVKTLMQSVGKAVVVDESQFHAVIGVSGSGPAYVYSFIAALADGGVNAGLPRAQAQELAVQTVIGAAKMVAETGQHPMDLRDAVASPGGTTIAAIHQLERDGLHSAVMNAAMKAAERSKEMAGS